ncbi:DUF3857 domain-containing transglutaminase family protein [Enterovibrio sp. ZSDZ35]|uniref:DUF3857 domain-containing transglutaminase family protein n=1 Tax=Enterovibrio qingdaonensis TaxID=2899818 RepID=A0ABT5QMX2_9GAMM|nr:DUF3857 domain-containing transglutaminase family protein [Enterovibrio sp. ZSDZ35]MDD1782331.1 DUF3857 domain-containing transglutaminase family protein [Enterovibrio sp. ZSDZ35]
MKNYLFALSVPILSIASAYADDNLYSPRPEWVIPIADLPTFTQQGHHYDQQYLLVDRQLDLTQPTPVEYKRYTSKIVSIEGVESASQLSIDFDPSYQTVNIHRLEIIRNGKVIDRKATAKTSQFKREVDLDSLLYNGEETLHLVLDDVRVGDTIDFSYSIAGFNPVFGEHREWYIKTGWATSVALVNTRIRVPKDSPIHVTNLENKGKGTVEERLSDNVRVFSYQEKNGLYDYDESEQPRWFNPYPYLHISSYQGWQDVVNWALPLYPSQADDDEVLALVEDIKDTYPDDLERQVVAAIHFVQNNIRYLGIENGIGSHKPRPPAQIVSQGYGDCKDKSLLLVSMLNALGVNAYPALVDTFWRDQLSEQPAAPFSFNHVIVQMIIDGTPWWIDATRTHQGSRLASMAQSRLGYALVIKPNNDALTEMAPPTIPVTQDVEQKYVVNHANTQSYLTVKTTYRGIEAERWRRYLESKPLIELGEEYANYYAAFFNALDLMRPLSVSDDRESNEVTVNEAYIIDGLWSKTEDAYTFVISGDIVDDYLTKPDLIRRKTPFRFGTEGAVRQKIKLSLPESWDVEPTNHTINGPYFEFKSSLSKVSAPGETLFDKTYVEANYFYRAKKRHVEAKELRQYLGDIDNAWNGVDYEFTYRP